MPRVRLIAIVLGASMTACAPAFNWREVQPAGSGVTLQFPCKPQTRTRAVMLDGEAVAMTMLSCSAQGLNFALVHAELGDPARVTPTLIAMRKALAANAEGREVKAAPFALAGMTPNEQAVRVRYAGRSPQGDPIEEEAAFFSRAMHVYQLAVLGTQLDAAAADAFFDGLTIDE
ncbi:MAG TPA: hypothetical protein PKC97_19525 [Burkholderiaceae bacterium]|nr:hypothetical protein [Burkholderiaceae bacterium]